MEDVKTLKKMRLFQTLSPEEMATAAKVLRSRSLKKGQTIIQERRQGGSLFLVKSGEFKVSHVIRGKERELGTFRPGDHFGEVSFIDGKPRSASIYATTDSQLLVLTKKAFDRLTSSRVVQVKLMETLLNSLCERLRQRNDTLDLDLSDLLPVSVFETDKQGNINFTNRSGLDSFGYAQEDFTSGLNIIRMMAPADQKMARRHLRAILAGETQHAQEYVACRKDGSEFSVMVHWDPLFKGPLAVGIRATLIDITERKQMEVELRQARDELELRIRDRTAQLRESEERYAVAIRGANDGLWDWNLLTDEIYYSPRWKTMLGYEDGAFVSSVEEWMKRIHDRDREHVDKAIEMHRAGTSSHLETEYRILHRDGTYRWMLCRGLVVRNSSGKANRMAGSQTDITDRKRMEEQLAHDALYDSLTGLPNRALFLDRLSLLAERARQQANRGSDYIVAVLYLDLDRFKNVNDSLGHMSGDDLLVTVAKRLNACIRPGDTVARLGGDEFAILLDQVRDSNDPIRVAKRIHNAFDLPFSLSGREVFVTVSIGIAISSTREEAGQQQRAEDLLRDADTAMYRAKAEGKARYEIFDKDMHARAVAALQLETDLRWALDRDEYEIYYQPIIYLPTGRIVGFEALIRWQHPEHGLILPAEFIPLAEETGLIVPIGLAVLQGACRQIHEWNQQNPSATPLFISVNVSGKQLMQQKFVRDIEKVLEDTNLKTGCLKLEITESVMMENTERTIALMSSLKSMGVKLDLDDFGTGYSSLSSLRRFPIDTLKIDKSFVSGMSHDSENLHIVSTIISLARNLGMTAVAEGVEEVLHLAQLKALQCDFAQGYYFSEPLDAKSAQAIIAKKLRW